MSCCVETHSWVEPARACVEPVKVVESCVPVTRPCEPSYAEERYVSSERRVGCPTTTYRDLGPTVRDCCAPACSPARVVEPAPRTFTTFSTDQPVVYHSAASAGFSSPIVVSQLHSVPEHADAADWVVVESAPRSVVRHNVVDQVGGIKTVDGRYVIGDPGAEDGILRLPDGRIRYADGSLQQASPGALKYAEGRASPSVSGLQGSIVMLSDGSTLHPDGTIEYPDGTIRRPTNLSYSAGAEYSEQAWAKAGGSTGLGALSQQVAELKAHIEKSDSAALKEQLRAMEAERRIFEKELQVMKECSVGPNSPQVLEKEDALRRLHEQFLAEVRQNAEARGVLKALQDERAREAETRKVLISEAVLRREQELLRDKERALTEVRQRVAQEKDALVAQERAQAQRLAETELSAERSRLQGEMQQLQDYAEAERKRADEEHQQACAERDRAMLAEEQLAALRLASPEKKKKKKKKGKKGKKGKKKSKATAKSGAVGVIGAAARRTVTTTTRTSNVVRKNRVVSKKPARR